MGWSHSCLLTSQKEWWSYLAFIAGQCRTNPRPAVADWTLMLECRWRTEAADYRKKCRRRTNFYPAFRHLIMNFQYHIARTRITPRAAVLGRAGCITFITTNSSSMNVQGVSLSSPPTQAVWTCRVYPVFKCRTVGLSGIQSVRYRNEKNVDAGTSPVAE